MSADRAPPSARRLAANLAANYAYLGFMALVTLLVVPVYVRSLGPDAWGSVALCMTMQGFLLAMDIVLGPLMLRDVAQAAQAGCARAAYRRFLRIHLTLAVPLFVLGHVALLAAGWLHPAFAAPAGADLLWALRLALVQFLFQFANNAAIGLWNGQQRQAMANGRLTGFAFLKHAGALLLVTQWAPSAAAYVLPFAAVGAIEFALNVRRALGERAPGAASDYRPTAWSEVLGFGLPGAIGMATAHVDRIYLSLALPAAEFGIYFLAGTLMLSMLHLQAPLQRAFLPRIATAESPPAAARAMLMATLALLVLPCLGLAALAEPALRLWLHDAALAAQVAPALRWLMIAAALNAAVGPSNALLLQARRYRTMAALNLAILLAQLVVLAVFTPGAGMLAGAYSWLAAGLIQAAFSIHVWRSTRTPPRPTPAAS